MPVCFKTCQRVTCFLNTSLRGMFGFCVFRTAPFFQREKERENVIKVTTPAVFFRSQRRADHQSHQSSRCSTNSPEGSDQIAPSANPQTGVREGERCHERTLNKKATEVKREGFCSFSEWLDSEKQSMWMCQGVATVTARLFPGFKNQAVTFYSPLISCASMKCHQIEIFLCRKS